MRPLCQRWRCGLTCFPWTCLFPGFRLVSFFQLATIIIHRICLLVALRTPGILIIAQPHHKTSYPNDLLLSGLFWDISKHCLLRWTYLQENQRLGSFVWSSGTQMRSIISIFCNKQMATYLNLCNNVTGGSGRWLLFQRGKDERHLCQRLAESTEELANDWSHLSNIDAATSYFFTILDLDFRALRTARQRMCTTGPWQGRVTSTGGF